MICANSRIVLLQERRWDLEWSPRTVVYGDHMKIRGSGTEVDVDVARRGWSADETRAQGEDLQAGHDVVGEQWVTHEHESHHCSKISIERATYQS
jgi:hypothetical protein